MTNFMVSSAGRRGALVEILTKVARSRGGGKVIAVDASPLSAAGQLADHFEIVPRIDSEDFIDSVLDVASRHAVDVIIPTIDPEIALYAENRELFRDAGVDVWAPSPACALLGFDKWLLFDWLRSHGIPTVETFQLGDPTWRTLEGPVVAKPRSGSSSIGVWKAGSVQELPPGLTEDYIIQTLARGVELTVDFAVNSDGRFLGSVPRQRLEVRAGEVAKALTVRAPRAEETAEQLAKELPGMYGVANVQMFFDEQSGGVNVIEINPRFGGGYPLSHAAGADFVTAMLDVRQSEAKFPLTWEAGLTMLRYDSAVFVRGIGAALP